MAETLPLAATAVGELRLPPVARALIVVASDRSDVDLLRDTLHDGGFATLRLHRRGSEAAASRKDVRDLIQDLSSAAGWIHGRPELAALPIGVFGARAAGGAALAAAAARPDFFRALVLRDPGPLVPGIVLDGVHAATLLIADAQDDESIARNQETMARVRGIAELEILSGTPVRDDPATIVQIAGLARRWFDRFLA
jgi:hypothetical protein